LYFFARVTSSTCFPALLLHKVTVQVLILAEFVDSFSFTNHAGIFAIRVWVEKWIQIIIQQFGKEFANRNFKLRKAEVNAHKTYKPN